MENIFKNQLLTSAVIVAGGLALSGCSSSSGGVTTPDGIYAGSITGGVTAANGGEKGIIYKNRMMVFSTAVGIQNFFESQLTVTDKTFTGTLNVYTNSTPLLTTAELSGSFVPGSTFTAAFINSPQTSFVDGTIDLTADTSLYNRGSSAATVTGGWQGEHGGVGDSTSFVVDATGDLTGSDVFGCVFTGTIVPADVKVNVYNVTIISVGGGACTGLPAATYSGLAWTEGASDTTLNLSVSDGINSRSVVLTKN